MQVRLPTDPLSAERALLDRRHGTMRNETAEAPPPNHVCKSTGVAASQLMPEVG